MDLKPMVITRIAQTVLWLAVAGLLVGYLISTQLAWPLTLAISVLIAAVAAFLIVRTHRMRVRYGPEGLEIRGLLLSRSIPAEQVVRVTGFPAVRWATATGSSRWTPIFAFYGIGQLASVERYNQFCILQLRTWDEERHPKPPSTGNPRRPRRGK